MRFPAGQDDLHPTRSSRHASVEMTENETPDDSHVIEIERKPLIDGPPALPPQPPTSTTPPPLFGLIPIKYLALILLVCQNSAYILTQRYSKTVEGPMYLSSTAVLFGEIVKVLICLGIIFYQEGSFERFRMVVYRDLIERRNETLKLLIPSGSYTLQNNLNFLAIANLQAATYQVTYQLKILTTALFMVFMLGTTLSRKKWLALSMLTLGVALVQVPASTLTKSVPHQNLPLGLFAVIASACLSGFGGVYFEKLLKGSEISVWMRNVQMGLFGTFFSIIGVFIEDYKALFSLSEFFRGYSLLVVIVILLSSVGGLLVAVVVKYADNILKGFATSISILVSSLVSVIIFDFTLHIYFNLGATLVIIATVLYNM